MKRWRPRQRYISTRLILPSTYLGVSEILPLNQIYDSRNQSWPQKDGN